jgi:hypothetical protein
MDLNVKDRETVMLNELKSYETRQRVWKVNDMQKCDLPIYIILISSSPFQIQKRQKREAT